MRGCRPAATLRRTSLDGCDATAFLDEAAGMKEQLVRIGDILDIQEFDLGIGLRIEVLVHILQHILNANLFAIADAPHTVELQTLDNGTLQDEHRRRTRAADEVNSLRVQIRDGEREHTMVVAVQQTNAVRTDQGSPILFTGVSSPKPAEIITNALTPFSRQRYST